MANAEPKVRERSGIGRGSTGADTGGRASVGDTSALEAQKRAAESAEIAKKLAPVYAEAQILETAIGRRLTFRPDTKKGRLEHDKKTKELIAQRNRKVLESNSLISQLKTLIRTGSPLEEYQIAQVTQKIATEANQKTIREFGDEYLPSKYR